MEQNYSYFSDRVANQLNCHTSIFKTCDFYVPLLGLFTTKVNQVNFFFFNLCNFCGFFIIFFKCSQFYFFEDYFGISL